VVYALSVKILNGFRGMFGGLPVKLSPTRTSVPQIRNLQACCTFAWQTIHFHSLGGSTELCWVNGWMN